MFDKLVSFKTNVHRLEENGLVGNIVILQDINPEVHSIFISKDINDKLTVIGRDLGDSVLFIEDDQRVTTFMIDIIEHIGKAIDKSSFELRFEGDRITIHKDYDEELNTFNETQFIYLGGSNTRVVDSTYTDLVDRICKYKENIRKTIKSFE